MPHFHTAPNAVSVVVGASRGLGLALSAALLQRSTGRAAYTVALTLTLTLTLTNPSPSPNPRFLTRDLYLRSLTYIVGRGSREPPVHSQRVPDSSPER